MSSALITGITGQDGSYLAELLLSKGYKVYGLLRRKSRLSYGNAVHLKDRLTFIYGDLLDISSLINSIKLSKPDEIYNLAAQSFVGTSWEQPLLTADVDGVGVLNLLEAVRITNSEAKIYPGINQ